MNHPPGVIDYKDIAYPVVAVLFLHAMVLYLPFFGIFAGMFTPLPLIFAYLVRGWTNSAVAFGVVALILSTLKGGLFTILFLIQYGVMAMVMGELIMRRLSRESVVLFSSIMPVLCGVVAIRVFFWGQDVGFLEFMTGKVNFAVSQTIQGYKEIGVEEEYVQALEMYSDQMIRLFVSLLPAWFISGSIVTAILNYSAIKKVWKRWTGTAEQPYFNEPRFSQWALTDYFIWIFIASGIFLLFPAKSVKIIGINLLALALVVYFIHGTAIVLHWLEKSRNYNLFLFLAVFLLMLQPFFLFVIAIIGIFDIWFDFRKLKVSGPPSTSGQDFKQ